MINFIEIPYGDNEQILQQIILQLDIGEQRNSNVLTMEIGNIDNVIHHLDLAINKSLEKGFAIFGLNFSNCDLINSELCKLVDYLIEKLKTIRFFFKSISNPNGCVRNRK